MNQTCKVCGEPAAGFHFGAFTCEGCKSFFGRSYNNVSSISECKNNGKCVIDKKNRTTCKACRLRKCYSVGMSKGGSRYGRRSNWFKIHCLLQEQQQQAMEAASKGPTANPFGDMTTAAVAAQQHMQRNNPHMPPHMSGLLGYPPYLPPEMMQSVATSPFMAGRHPADAAAAAALPFFSMMNSLPSIGSPQSAFQLPPHLLFSPYHPGSAADAYRAEMFKHRQSVDSAASAESQRLSPGTRSQHSNAEDERLSVTARESQTQSPELCVSGDEDHQTSQCEEKSRLSVMSHHSSVASPLSSHHTIHSPIPIRATPKIISPVPITTPFIATTTEPTSACPAVSHSSTLQQQPQSTLTFTAKMQSLSPVSVCSITGETTATVSVSVTATDQDCPIDLSMKGISRSSVQSFNSSTASGESELHSDVSCEEELLRQTEATTAIRRKFFQLNNEHESDASSCDAPSSENVKRPKHGTTDAAAASQSYNGGFNAHNATSLRGIFVCV